MPSGRERNLFAKKPISTPATRPLNVEPITMPTISGRTAGAENHADIPSKIPRKPPSSSPNTGLFIRSPPVRSVTRLWRAPLARQENQGRTHDQIDGDQEQRRPVPPSLPEGPLDGRLLMRRHRTRREERRHVAGERLDR